MLAQSYFRRCSFVTVKNPYFLYEAKDDRVEHLLYWPKNGVTSSKYPLVVESW